MRQNAALVGSRSGHVAVLITIRVRADGNMEAAQPDCAGAATGGDVSDPESQSHSLAVVADQCATPPIRWHRRPQRARMTGGHVEATERKSVCSGSQARR